VVPNLQSGSCDPAHDHLRDNFSVTG